MFVKRRKWDGSFSVKALMFIGYIRVCNLLEEDIVYVIFSRRKLYCLLKLVRSGGFRRIYAGLGPAALGSAPGAALFFCTYETSKKALAGALPAPAAHMAAASLGEVAACIVRVPIEIVKQVGTEFLLSSLPTPTPRIQNFYPMQ